MATAFEAEIKAALITDKRKDNTDFLTRWNALEKNKDQFSVSHDAYDSIIETLLSDLALNNNHQKVLPAYIQSNKDKLGYLLNLPSTKFKDLATPYKAKMLESILDILQKDQKLKKAMVTDNIKDVLNLLENFSELEDKYRATIHEKLFCLLDVSLINGLEQEKLAELISEINAGGIALEHAKELTSPQTKDNTKRKRQNKRKNGDAKTSPALDDAHKKIINEHFNPAIPGQAETNGEEAKVAKELSAIHKLAQEACADPGKFNTNPDKLTEASTLVASFIADKNNLAKLESESLVIQQVIAELLAYYAASDDEPHTTLKSKAKEYSSSFLYYCMGLSHLYKASTKTTQVDSYFIYAYFYIAKSAELDLTAANMFFELQKSSSPIATACKNIFEQQYGTSQQQSETNEPTQFQSIRDCRALLWARAEEDIKKPADFDVRATNILKRITA